MPASRASHSRPTPRGIFTAAEVPLIQDGDAPTFEPARARAFSSMSHVTTPTSPRASLPYDLEPLAKTPFEASFAINGLVELLALDRTTLLALERGIRRGQDESGARPQPHPAVQDHLAGATNISGLESLKGQTDVLPATKTLLLDLSEVKGLSPDLGAESRQLRRHDVRSAACRMDGPRCYSSATTTSGPPSGRGSCSLRYSRGQFFMRGFRR